MASCTARRRSSPAILAMLMAMAAALSLSACSEPRGEETSLGQIVQNRPDGLRFNQQHAQLVSRWRGPMDHGPGVQASRIDFRVWDLRFAQNDAPGGNATLRQSPVAYSFERNWLGSGNGPQNPAFLTIGGRNIPTDCFSHDIARADRSGTMCAQPTDTPAISQTGGRFENLTVSRGQLVFGDGLGGRNTRCAVNLQQGGPDISQPMPVPLSAANMTADGSAGSENWPGWRFAVSYLPPDYAYVVDYAQPTLPIYLASCGGMELAGHILPLPAGVDTGGAPVTPHRLRLLDMVKDPGQSQPAVFIALDDRRSGGYILTVIRQGRAPQVIPTFWHDGMSDIFGFYRGSPDWLLLDASLSPRAGQMTAQLSLYDLAHNRGVTRRYSVADTSRWPARPRPALAAGKANP